MKNRQHGRYKKARHTTPELWRFINQGWLTDKKPSSTTRDGKVAPLK